MALQFEIIPVTAFQQNCTLIWDSETREAILTDVGGDINLLIQRITTHQLQLVGIWLTHAHLDHINGVVPLSQHYPVPIYGPHQSDEFWIQQLPEITRLYRFPLGQPFTPTAWLEEGMQLSVGQYIFEVLHIPGHTPGHVVFYCHEEQLLIAGDVLFYESIGRTDFPGSNHQDLILNIHQKLLTLPGNTRVIPGHGPMTTIGHEKQFNPFLI